MKIIAIDKKTKEEFEIDDLYFFEEQYIHKFDDSREYDFRFVIEDGDNVSIKAELPVGFSMVSLPIGISNDDCYRTVPKGKEHLYPYGIVQGYPRVVPVAEGGYLEPLYSNGAYRIPWPKVGE